MPLQRYAPHADGQAVWPLPRRPHAATMAGLCGARPGNSMGKGAASKKDAAPALGRGVDRAARARDKEGLMKIGIIGAGHIGGTLAEKFVEAGHLVGLSNAHGPQTLEMQAAQLGDSACPMTVADAEKFGELVVVAIPFGRYHDVPSEPLAGKIVVDTMNYYAQRDGHFPELEDDSTTSSELLQEHLARSRLVKAFNTMRWDHLKIEGREPGDPASPGHRHRRRRRPGEARGHRPHRPDRLRSGGRRQARRRRPPAAARLAGVRRASGRRGDEAPARRLAPAPAAGR